MWNLQIWGSDDKFKPTVANLSLSTFYFFFDAALQTAHTTTGDFQIQGLNYSMNTQQ